MKLGFARTVRGKKANVQAAELEAAGIDVVYVDNLVDLIASLREDDVLAVAGGLHVLSPIRRGILEIVQEVHDAGCTVEDITNEQTSKGDGIPMLALAIDAISAESRFGDPVKAGKKGGLARWAKEKKPMRTSQRKALGPWRDRALTIEQALAHPDMDGWTKNSAYRKLKRRGIFRERD